MHTGILKKYCQISYYYCILPKFLKLLPIAIIIDKDFGEVSLVNRDTIPDVFAKFQLYMNFFLQYTIGSVVFRAISTELKSAQPFIYQATPGYKIFQSADKNLIVYQLPNEFLPLSVRRDVTL